MLKPYAPWILLGLWLALAATPAVCGLVVLYGPRDVRRRGNAPPVVGGVLNYATPERPEASMLLTGFAWAIAALPMFVMLASLATIAEVWRRYGGPPRPFVNQLPVWADLVFIPFMFSMVLPIFVGPIAIGIVEARRSRSLVSRTAAWALVLYGVFTTLQVYPAVTVVRWVMAN